MNFWEKGKPPDLGALWLAPSVEKDVVVLGIDCDRFFLKNKKTTRQLWSHNVPMPIKFWWNWGII